MTACTLERNWEPYIIACVVTFFGGLVILVPIRLAWTFGRNKKKETHKRFRKIRKWLTSIRTFAESALSGSSIPSKVVVMFFWITDTTSLAVYLTEAIMFDPVNPMDRENCGPVWSDPIQIVWMSLMIVNLIRFIITFCAAHDKLLMWIDLYSIVDHLTIVPSVVGGIKNRNWIALRLVVVVHILKIPDILQMIYILKDRNQIRIAHAISIILAVWLLGTGIIFLLENNGDPFRNFENFQELKFGECFYFILITLATIGYGDISPKSVLGRASIIVLAVLALAVFGSLIPELGKAVASREKYRKPYKRSYNKRHVIICGDITFDMLSTVVLNFVHKDAAIKDVDIVIIDKDKPGSELQAFFRRHFSDVTFIRGSVIDIPTLQLAKTKYAAAAFILANRRAENPEEEDSANIMRATAIKNLSDKTRVIIQLLRHQNKKQLLNIPGWNWNERSSNGDEVICVSELQMALMAQNCLAPGIVTMFSNLICMRSTESSKGMAQWMRDYNYGAGHEIYAQQISESNGLVGLAFTEAAEICFQRFDVLLVAVEYIDTKGATKLNVNPGRHLPIEPGFVGFFIAQDPSQMKSVANYKYTINRGYERNGTRSAQTGLPAQEIFRIATVTPASPEVQFEFLDANPLGRHNSSSNTEPVAEASDGSNSDRSNRAQEKRDVTGTTHSCPERPIESVLLDRGSVLNHDFSNHVIFILRCGTSDASEEGADVQTDLDLGLRSFVSPLRTSSLPISSLKDIIFYTNVEALKNEWKELANFPKLFVYQNTRAVPMDLRLLNIHKCDMCIVVSVNGASVIDNAVVDKRTILTTMNIHSLQKLEEKVNSIGVLTNAETFRKQIAIRSDFPLLAKLESDASVPYIDVDDEDDPSLPVFQTTPYVSGRVLLASVFDSAVSAAFSNAKILKLIRALLTGGELSDLERIMADGVGIVRRARLQNDSTGAEKRSHLALLSLAHGPLEQFKNSSDYGELLANSLRTFGILPLGVYRLLEADSKDPKHQKRFVITSPRSSFKLLPSDKIYVLQPFGVGNESGKGDTSF